MSPLLPVFFPKVQMRFVLLGPPTDRGGVGPLSGDGDGHHSSVSFFHFRLREERGDAERALALDQKVRELNSQNGEYIIDYAC